MSDHQAYILQRDSPPSLELSEEKQDSLSESYPSMPITPNSPSDIEDCGIPFKQDIDPTHFDNKTEVMSDTVPIEDGNNPSNRTSDLSTNDNILSTINSKVDTLSNNILENSNDKLCSRNNDDNLSSSVEIKVLKPLKVDTISDSMKLESKNSQKDSSIPKLISTLTLTDDHPLMMLSSPDSPPSTGNYPDLILPSCKNKDDNHVNKHNENNHFVNSDCSGIMSLSSTEDESFNRSMANGDVNSLHSDSFSTQYGPQRNTSKNNLYFTDTFVSSDGSRSVEDNFGNDHVKHAGEHNAFIQPDILDSGKIKNEKNSTTNFLNPPDVAIERKKIKPDVRAPKINSAMKSNMETYKILGREINPITGQQIYSNTNSSQKSDNSISKSSIVTSTETKSDVSTVDDIPSPDSSTASRPENERSLYLAEVDPYGGCVSLKPRSKIPSELPPKKRIKPLLTETDTESTVVSNTLFASCQNELSGSTSSIDSLSDCSLHSDSVFQDNVPAVSNPLNPQIQPVPVLKQIHALKGSIDDECSDTETETECPLKNKISCDDDGNEATDKIPEYSLSEERQDTRRWLKVTLPSGEKRSIDMKVIEPYKRVLSHGGYALSGRRDAIVVFSACYLPDSSRVDYNYVMDNLFLYVLTTLEQLVTDDYILVYLHGSASKRSMPTFHWLKKCYQLIDRRLRKSLKHLYLVHPTFWLKSIMWMTKPFISTKFSRKLSYVHTLEELEGLVPVEYAAIPEKVRRYDSRRSSAV